MMLEHLSHPFKKHYSMENLTLKDDLIADLSFGIGVHLKEEDKIEIRKAKSSELDEIIRIIPAQEK